MSLYSDLCRHFPQWHLPWGALGDILTRLGRSSEAVGCYHRQILIAVERKCGAVDVRHSANVVRCPDFIITGFPKCGTTSLYLYLRQHPSIVTCHRKEISYFNKYSHERLEWYAAHFPPELENVRIVSGDATPEYAVTIGVEAEVARLPRIPLCIFLVRDPVERTVSHYHHRRRLGVESDAPLNKPSMTNSICSSLAVSITTGFLPRVILGAACTKFI